MARVLEAEGVETLFVPSIRMGNEPTECIRYDALARAFVGAPLHAVIWELAHAFGSVRLVKGKVAIAKLDCFWAGKSPAQWSSETLSCSFADGQKAASSRARDEVDHPRIPIENNARTAVIGTSVSRAETNESNNEERSKSKSRKARTMGAAELKGSSERPVSALPRASLPQSLKYLGAVRRQHTATPAQIADLNPGTTADTVRRAFDLLQRIGLLEEDGGSYRASNDANAVNEALERADLDAVSLFLARFEPYSVFLELLRSRAEIHRGEVVPLLRERFGSIGAEEGARLPRFHSLAGQAWTDGDLILDGSRRLTDRDAADAFQRAFAATAVEGLAVDFH